MSVQETMLAAAIERLYDVFSRYEPRTLHRSCTCCVTNEDIQSLQEKQLRRLSTEDLSNYAFKAITTFGTVDDYKYFLPRLCELIATAVFPKDTEVVLAGKLEAAAFRDWPADERQAVRAYLLALWEDVLSRWPHHVPADTVLCCIARVLGSPAAALSTWSALLPRDRSARLHLAAWLCWGPGCHDRPPPFWEQASLAWEQVVTWLRSPTTAAQTEVAMADWARTPEGAEWLRTSKR